ncbi:hypothetical protein JW960_11970 [candidate division KSB1 bacterium]|nr:hypothetical protein [candidate division KSB1 bacterium]
MDTQGMHRYQNVVLKIMVLLFMLGGAGGCDKLLMRTDDNNRPEIKIRVQDDTPAVQTSQTFKAEVVDPDVGDSVAVSWTVTAGRLAKDTGDSVSWTAPNDTMSVEVTAIALDSKGARALAYKILHVGNSAPDITDFTVDQTSILNGNTVNLACTATDPDGHELMYQYSVVPNQGTLVHSDAHVSTATWTAPSSMPVESKVYKIIVSVKDVLGYSVADTVDIVVYFEYSSIWVVDSGQKRVSKYAGNGQLILTASESFSKPVAVTNNIDESYGCYVADYEAGSIYKIGADGETLLSYTGVNNVIDIAVHNDTRTVWAISTDDNSLTVFDGFTDAEIKRVYGIENPRQIIINQASDDVWIVETGNNRIVNFKAENLPYSLPDTVTGRNTLVFPSDTSSAYLNAPFGSYVRNQTNQILYVSDKNDNQVERLEWRDGGYKRDKNPISIMPLRPMYASVSLLANRGWTVFVMSTNGKIVLFPEEDDRNIMTAAGDYRFEYPHALATDESNCEFWVGDNGTTQLVKIKIQPDYTFKAETIVSGFVFIEDVVINK